MQGGNADGDEHFVGAHGDALAAGVSPLRQRGDVVTVSSREQLARRMSSERLCAVLSGPMRP